MQLRSIKWIHIATYPSPPVIPRTFPSSQTETLSPSPNNSHPLFPSSGDPPSTFCLAPEFSRCRMEGGHALSVPCDRLFHARSCPRGPSTWEQVSGRPSLRPSPLPRCGRAILGEAPVGVRLPPPLAAVNNAATNMSVQRSICTFSPPGRTPEVGWRGQVLIPCEFLRNCPTVFHLPHGPSHPQRQGSGFSTSTTVFSSVLANSPPSGCEGAHTHAQRLTLS